MTKPKPPNLQELLEVQDYFGLPSPALVEKDYYVAKALAAIMSVNTGRLNLVFSGGTALGRAHKLIHRMSEDIDLKITAEPAPTKAELRQLRTDICHALLTAGFVFDPAKEEYVASRNNTKYTLYKLPYQAITDGQGALRPEIQIETAQWPVRLPTIPREVKSFYAEAFKWEPEVTKIACVCIPETAAEKFVALTRRVAAECQKPFDQRDKTLVRHIYDLYVIQSHYSFAEITPLIPTIMRADAEAYCNQYPPYRADPHGETWKALEAMEKDSYYAIAYAELNRDMVYGQKVVFSEGIALLKQIATAAISTPTTED